MNGWKAVRIIETTERGSSWLESLDPFNDLDALLTQATNDEISLTNLDEDEREAFTNPYAECDEKKTTTIFIYSRMTIELSFIYLKNATEAEEDWL